MDVDNNHPERKIHRLPQDCYRGGDPFFITICTSQKSRVLIDEPCRTVLKIFLDEQADKSGGPVNAYVIMPDHVHIVVSGVTDAIQWVRWFKARIAFFARKSGFNAELWQRGFYDEGIRKPEKSTEVFQYMRNNPVEAGLVKNPDDWELKYGC